MSAQLHETAIWAVTENGRRLAEALRSAIPHAALFLKEGLPGEHPHARYFTRLSEAVDRHFPRYGSHIFIMATGIVVRLITGHLIHKTSDPAVVVADDTGRHAISLVSGHIGGANRLATRVADILGARPVITTATDNNGVPAIDVIAVEQNLAIENPEAIRAVSMALLEGRPVTVQDPYRCLPDEFGEACGQATETGFAGGKTAAVVVNDRTAPHDNTTLVLRPSTLAVGIGCNRGTPQSEMRQLLTEVFEEQRLSLLSVCRLATIDIKRDENGINQLAAALHLPVHHFTREKLNSATGIQSVSAAAEKHLGVKSVCEAAAILAAGNGTLIVPKRKSKNVTLAVARRPSISSG